MTVCDFVKNVLKTIGAVELVLTNYTGEDVVYATTDPMELIEFMNYRDLQDAKLLEVEVSHNSPEIFIAADIA